MAEGTAHYMHTTLFQFSDAARARLVKEFDTAMQDVRTTCRVDTANHVVHVECPTDRGPRADQLAGEIIARMIQEQTQADDSEDAMLIRYPESCYVSLDNTTEQSEPTFVQPVGGRVGRDAPLVSDIVTKAKHLQLFPLPKMIDKRLERVLMPRTSRSEKIVSESFLLCAVRFVEKEQRYVFNGRTSGQPSPSIRPYSNVLDHIRFPDVGQDARAKSWDRLQSADASIPLHTTKDEDLPGIPGWLAEMEKAGPSAPDIRPDVPSEARNLVAPQVGLTSRARVPKGHRASLIEPSIEPESRDVKPQFAPSFDELLAADGRKPPHSQAGPATDTVGAKQSEPTAPDPPAAFPTYGKQFATVDRMGLTAHAASTARWENENRVVHPVKSKQRVVALRPLGMRKNQNTNAVNSQVALDRRERLRPSSGDEASPSQTDLFHIHKGRMVQTAGFRIQHKEMHPFWRKAASLNRLRQRAISGDPGSDEVSDFSDDSDDTAVALDAHTLCAELCLLLTTLPDQSVAQKTFKPDRLQKLLNETKDDAPLTRVSSRLTTSLVDADYTAGLRPAGFNLCQSKATFEIKLQIPEGLLDVEYCPDNPTMAYTIRERDSVHATNYVHFPEHVWDARIRIVSQPEDIDQAENIRKGVEDFLGSIRVHSSPLTVRGKYPTGQFKPCAVLAKRACAFSDGTCSFIVTEVQVLELRDSDTPRDNFKACAVSRQEMIETQRLWIEARLESGLSIDPATVRKYVEHMVQHMDCVGRDNRGPWIRKPGHDEDV